MHAPPEIAVGIVGGGIAGLAIALALQRSGRSCVVFEKDVHVDVRAQGYGLTLQQGGRAMRALGLADVVPAAGVASSSHFIFDSSGRLVLFWGSPSQVGADKWDPSRNCHIARQTLRKSLLEALDENFVRILWGSSVSSISQENEKVLVTAVKYAQPSDMKTRHEFDVLIGCDGLRSVVRDLCISESCRFPLRYLHTFVMLGIVPNEDYALLHDRMLQMSDPLGTRIFVMPFDSSRSMWQLSWPMENEDDALALSRSGSAALKAKALALCAEFSGCVVDVLTATSENFVTGYPVYDRDPSIDFEMAYNRVTLAGDAAHPMSPFKGQGANQALIDAVDLGDCLSRARENIPESLRSYEAKMKKRTKAKVKASYEAIKELHCANFANVDYQLARRGYSDPEAFRDLILRLREEGASVMSSVDVLASCIERQNALTSRLGRDRK
ncbi:hypothetical protein HDU83_002100 [Entophlyctis luteolus]|nr:hypothetical protein HDU83_002100 [Entophlyctis luteolus]